MGPPVYGKFPHIRAPYSYDYDHDIKSRSTYSNRHRRHHRRPEVKTRPLIKEVFENGARPAGSRPDVITMPNIDHGDNVSLLDKTFNQEQSTAFPFHEEPEIVEDENGTEINVDLPGVKSEDLKVELDDTVMIINGMRRASDGKWKPFERSFELDVFTIDVESIKANLLDGVLTITIEKKDSGAALNIEVTTFEEGEEEALLKKKEEEEKKQEEKKKKAAQRAAAKRRMTRIKAQRGDATKESPFHKFLPKPGEDISLMIEIMSCDNLLRGDRIGNRGKGKSDPYVKALLGDEILHETKYITQTLNPVFKARHNNAFVYNGKAEDLIDAEGVSFLIMDFDMGTTDDPLGEVFVGIEDLLTMDGDVAEFDIDPPSHRARERAGTIQIRVSHATNADRKKFGKPARRRTTYWKPPPKELYEKDASPSVASSYSRSAVSHNKSLLSKSVKSNRSRNSSLRGSRAQSPKYQHNDFC